MSQQQKNRSIARTAIAGDPDAWESILRFSFEYAHALAVKQGLSPSEARELASDVVEKVRVCLAGFASKPDGSFEGWLYYVLQSCKYDRRRTQSRDAKRYTSLSAVLNQATEESNGEERLMRKERQDEVGKVLWRAVGRLPELDRTIVLWRYRDGKGCREIAVTLNMSYGAVRNRLWRATTQRLRRDLEGLQHEAHLR